MPRVRFTDDRARDQLRERPFELLRDGRRVPGVLWTPPQASGPFPLVLIGHGGAGSKYQSHVVAVARGLAQRHGVASAALDGPVHGERRSDPDAPGALVLMQFAQLWANDGDAMTDAMVADWRAVLDALGALPDFAGMPVGWWGLSLGTILGLPLVAAEPRIAAAVLGHMGLTGPTRERIARDAPAVRCPALYLLQWDDEMFDRADSLALFGALGSADKRLHAFPGGHGELPDEGFVDSVTFLADRLLPPPGPRGPQGPTTRAPGSAGG